MDRVKLVDGTLREGEQTPGVYFTVEEKVMIARELDRINVPILDVGMPSVSSQERAAIAAISGLGLKASIGVSARLKRTEVNQALECGAEEIFLICPVSPLHLKIKLGTDQKGAREMARNVVSYAAQKGLVVNLVAEDATRAEVLFLADILSEAHDRGALRAFICDTVGVIDPFKMKDLISNLKTAIPDGMALGVHCHDDLGLATANTLAAVKAGADYPSVTVNGIGERAGNAPLQEVVLGLEEIMGRTHGISTTGLYSLSQLVERISGVFISPHAPIVGINAFRHESGIHVDGILKENSTYEALDPQEVNRKSSIVLGKHSGAGSIKYLLDQRGYKVDEALLGEILERVKEEKVRNGKKEIQKMLKEIEAYYKRSLSFPEKDFWEIVEGVVEKDRTYETRHKRLFRRDY